MRLHDPRPAFIEAYAFPEALRAKLREHYPHLREDQVTLVLEGLRAWFRACLDAKGSMIGMPSRAVDTAWHEFILMTREYHAFCEGAFERYLHHEPEATMDMPMGEAIARTLKVTSKRAHTPADQLPDIFLIDGLLAIEDGFTWNVGELRRRRADTGGGGSGCGSGSSSDGGGHQGGGHDGGGCSGGSCGGSCGGGCGGG